jgi:hypothetical protein
MCGSRVARSMSQSVRVCDSSELRSHSNTNPSASASLSRCSRPLRTQRDRPRHQGSHGSLRCQHAHRRRSIRPDGLQRQRDSTPSYNHPPPSIWLPRGVEIGPVTLARSGCDRHSLC